MNTDKRQCSICEVDLTNKPYIVSSHCYSLINGASLCDDCAKVDLKVAHLKALQASSIYRSELKEELRTEIEKDIKKEIAEKLLK